MHPWRAPRKNAPERFFIDPTSAPRPQSFLSGSTADIVTSGSIFLAVILIAAALYVIGSPSDNGLRPTYTIDPGITGTNVGFREALYFSVITIATVGYGDYRPIGYGRLVAASEAVSGLLIAGFLISRLVSRQQDRLTKRLVRGLMTAELKEFREGLTGWTADFLALPPIGAAYPADLTRTGLVDRIAGLAKSMARYWRHEAQNPDLGDVVPLPLATRTLGDMYDLLLHLEADINGQTPASIGENNRSRIRNITEGFLAIGCCLESASSDQAVRHSCDRIENVVGHLRQQLQLERL